MFKRFFIVFLICTFICTSSVFAEVTDQQATTIVNELSSTSGNSTLKYYIQRIFESCTSTVSTNGLLKNLQDIEALLINNLQSTSSPLYSLLNTGLAQVRNNLQEDGVSVASMVSDLLETGLDLDVSVHHNSSPYVMYRDNPTDTLYRQSFSSARFPLLLEFQRNGDNVYGLATAASSISPESIGDWLNILNNNFVYSVGLLRTFNTGYNASTYDYDNFETVTYRANSLFDFADVSLGSLVESVGRLSAFLVDPDDIELKQVNEDLNDEVKENILTPGRGSSLSVDNVRGFTSVAGKTRGFSTGSVDASDAFDVLEDDSDTWLFFSQDVLDDMVTVSDPVDADPGRDGRMLLMSPAATQPSSYDLYMQEVLDALD